MSVRVVTVCVNLFDPAGDVVSFVPGDSLPGWAVSLVSPEWVRTVEPEPESERVVEQVVVSEPATVVLDTASEVVDQRTVWEGMTGSELVAEAKRLGVAASGGKKQVLARLLKHAATIEPAAEPVSVPVVDQVTAAADKVWELTDDQVVETAVKLGLDPAANKWSVEETRAAIESHLTDN